MKKGFIPVAILVCLLLSACASTRGPEPVEGIKLVDMRAPASFKVGKDQPVVLNFETDGITAVERVCFRWMTEERFDRKEIPQCYQFDNTGHAEIDRACEKWLYHRPYKSVSQRYCVPASEITTIGPGEISVNLPAPAQGDYLLVGFIEFADGETKELSNSMSSQVFVGY